MSISVETATSIVDEKSAEKNKYPFRSPHQLNNVQLDCTRMFDSFLLLCTAVDGIIIYDGRVDKTREKL